MAKTITVNSDNLDQPNGPDNRNLPERTGTHNERSRPASIATFVFAGVSSFFVFVVGCLLWAWSDQALNGYNDTEHVLAWFFRGTIVLSFPVLIVGLLSWLAGRGLASILLSRTIRLQNGMPVDAYAVRQFGQSVIEKYLADHYATDRTWAAHSDYRGLNGSYAPSIEISSQAIPPAVLPGGPLDDMLGVGLNPRDPLPGIITLDSVLGETPAGHIAYGRSDTGTLIHAPVGQNYHALRSGETGQGKTTATNAEIVQLHRIAAAGGPPFELYGGDFKRELRMTWRSSPLFKENLSEPGDIADLLEYLLKEISYRQELFEKASRDSGRVIQNLKDYRTVTGERLPIRYIYIDELNAIVDKKSALVSKKVRERIDAALRNGLQTGRSSGHFYECGAQYLTAAIFDRAATKQFSTRAYFGAYDATSIGMVFGGRIPADEQESLKTRLNGQPGVGLFTGIGIQPTVIQSVYVDESDILDSIKLLT